MTAPQLSRVRTVLFGGMVLVWFTEMTFLGFQPLSRVWAHLWQVPVPDSAELATALYVTWATGAPSKAALGVMAVFGFLSKDARARTGLFVAMALVPPLNIAFPFRDQGFLFGPVAVATSLSTLLWVSFFIFREHAAPQSDRARAPASARRQPSLGQILPTIWFSVYAGVLTAMALLFLFWPQTALQLTQPYLAGLTGAEPDRLTSLIHATHASGTHLLAVGIGFWIATVYCRSNAVLRRALATAGIVHAGLFIVFPWRQMLIQFGSQWAASSWLLIFAPLFFGWLLYAFLRYRSRGARVPALIG